MTCTTQNAGEGSPWWILSSDDGLSVQFAAGGHRVSCQELQGVVVGGRGGDPHHHPNHARFGVVGEKALSPWPGFGDIRREDVSGEREGIRIPPYLVASGRDHR